MIIGAKLGDYNGDEQMDHWLTYFNVRLKLKEVSNGNGCIGNCIVNGGTDFCNKNIRFTILAANWGHMPNQKSIVSVNNIFTALLPGDMEGPAASKIAAGSADEVSCVQDSAPCSEQASQQAGLAGTDTT